MDIRDAMGGRGDLPALANQFHGKLLIMGGAACVRDDLKAMGEWAGDRMAVNDIGAHFHGTIHHWVTLHPEYMAGWLKYRMGHNYGNRGHVYTHSDKPAEGIGYVWDVANVGGSSGLFGCLIALLMGYSDIVLAGIPCDATPHYFDIFPCDGQLGGRDTEIVWCEMRDLFAGRVKSMSGRTKLWLGAP